MAANIAKLVLMMSIFIGFRVLNAQNCYNYNSCNSCILNKRCVFVQTAKDDYICILRQKAYPQIKRIFRTEPRCNFLAERLSATSTTPIIDLSTTRESFLPPTKPTTFIPSPRAKTFIVSPHPKQPLITTMEVVTILPSPEPTPISPSTRISTTPSHAFFASPPPTQPFITSEEVPSSPPPTLATIAPPPPEITEPISTERTISTPAPNTSTQITSATISTHTHTTTERPSTSTSTTTTTTQTTIYSPGTIISPKLTSTHDSLHTSRETTEIKTAPTTKPPSVPKNPIRPINQKRLVRDIKTEACRLLYKQSILLNPENMGPYWIYMFINNPMRKNPKLCKRLLRNKKYFL